MGTLNNYTNSNLYFQLSHACKIILANGTVARNETSRGRFFHGALDCALGPLSGNITYEGQDAQVFFSQPPNLKEVKKTISRHFHRIKKLLHSFRSRFFGSGGIRGWFSHHTDVEEAGDTGSESSAGQGDEDVSVVSDLDP